MSSFKDFYEQNKGRIEERQRQIDHVITMVKLNEPLEDIKNYILGNAISIIKDEALLEALKRNDITLFEFFLDRGGTWQDDPMDHLNYNRILFVEENIDFIKLLYMKNRISYFTISYLCRQYGQRKIKEVIERIKKLRLLNNDPTLKDDDSDPLDELTSGWKFNI